MELREYQVEAVENMLKLKDGMRVVVNAPTGSGKTIIMSKYCELQKDKHILIVVDAEELLLQTKDKMMNFVSEDEIGLIQSDKYNELDKRITVSMRQTILHPKSTRLDTLIENNKIDIMIVDECHIAPEAQLKLVEKVQPNITIGFSATPYSDLSKVYKDGECYHIPILKLIHDGYLCEPRAYTAHTNVDLTDIKTVAGDFVQGDLAEAINVEDRNRLIVDKWLEVASNRKHTIAFCASIQHAIDLAEEFNKQGISSCNLDSTFSNEERHEVINKYESGEIKVVCQVGIMVKGYDFPATDCILLCKATKSLIYYQQSVGRGLRIAEEKDDCIVIDIVDNFRRKNMTLLNMEMVFGLKEGETVSEKEEREIQEAIERERKIKEEQARIEALYLEEVNLFNENIFNVRCNSTYDWFFNKINGCDVAILKALKDVDIYIVKKDNEFTLYSRKQLEGYNYNLKECGKSSSLKELSDFVELSVSNNGDSQLLNPKSSWKFRPATEKQIIACKGKHVETQWDVQKYFSKRNSWFTLKDII